MRNRKKLVGFSMTLISLLLFYFSVSSSIKAEEKETEGSLWSVGIQSDKGEATGSLTFPEQKPELKPSPVPNLATRSSGYFDWSDNGWQRQNALTINYGSQLQHLNTTQTRIYGTNTYDVTVGDTLPALYVTSYIPGYRDINPYQISAPSPVTFGFSTNHEAWRNVHGTALTSYVAPTSITTSNTEDASKIFRILAGSGYNASFGEHRQFSFLPFQTSRATLSYDSNFTTIGGVPSATYDFRLFSSSTFRNPQIVKSVNIDMDTGANLGYGVEAGRGQRLGTPTSINKAAIPGYELDRVEVYVRYRDDTTGSPQLSETLNGRTTQWSVFNGLSEHKYGLVWYYKKAAPKLTISKSATAQAVIGTSISYRIDVRNSGNLKVTDPVVSDTLPIGVSKPTYITGNNFMRIEEGKENSNSKGEYFTWDEGTRELKVYLGAELAVNTGYSFNFSSLLESGKVGEEKINTATFSGSNTSERVTDSANTKIIQLDLAIEKVVDKEALQVGDTAHYEIKHSATGGLLYRATITDVLPEGMGRPENIRINGQLCLEVENLTEEWFSDEFSYEWDEATRTLKACQRTALGMNGITSRTLSYDTKLLAGNDGDILTNVATFSAMNDGGNQPSAEATVRVIGKEVTLHVKQEVLHPHEDIVVPSTAAFGLTNVSAVDPSIIGNHYTMTAPSYSGDTGQPFKTVKLEQTHTGYQLENVLPEFYEQVGYQITTTEAIHQSDKLTQGAPPLLDYTQSEAFWVTVYIQPKKSAHGPPFYSWDYKMNEFGELNW